MANRMAVHLTIDHKLSVTETHKIIDEVFARVLEHIKRKRHESAIR
jgi:divalent metal cation (Fe/Co/Zn/Cd) transporter